MPTACQPVTRGRASNERHPWISIKNRRTPEVVPALPNVMRSGPTAGPRRWPKLVQDPRFSRLGVQRVTHRLAPSSNPWLGSAYHLRLHPDCPGVVVVSLAATSDEFEFFHAGDVQLHVLALTDSQDWSPVEFLP